MSGQDFVNDPALLIEFIAQSFEYLDDIERKLLDCEADPECPDHIDCVFRAAHTIKGTSAFFNLQDINKICHQLETALDRLRKKERVIDKDAINLLLTGFDIVRMYIEKVNRRIDAQVGLLVSQEGANERVDSFMESLDSYLTSEQSAPATKTALSFEVTDKLILEFQYEASGHLDTAEECLIKLDKSKKDVEAVNELFRAMHSIKGIASYLRFEHITRLAHAYENMLDQLRAKPDAELPESIISLCFNGVDAIKAMVLDPINSANFDISELLDRLDNIQKELDKGRQAAPHIGARSSDPLSIFMDSAYQHLEAMRHCYDKALENETPTPANVDMFFRAAHSLKSSARYMQFERIEHAAMLIESALSSLREGKLGFAPAIMDMLQEALEEIERQLRKVGGREEDLISDDPALECVDAIEAEAEEREAPVCAGTTPSAADAAKAAAQPKTMRINQQLLDVFMNLVGELIVARNALSHVGKMLSFVSEQAPVAYKEYLTTMQSIYRISDSMQRSVMEMRMVPVRNVFMKFPRMIRDITQKNGKKVELLQFGEDTEIDKGVAEEIGDPLVHLIRNSVDHGIETPEQRARAGKAERGTVMLKASHQGNSIVIEIIDDGAGIDPAVVGAKAVEKGLVTPEKLRDMSDEDIFQFIFVAGFSTAAKVTDISGRGVGMDVVRTNLQKLNGAIRVSSEVGQGTHIRLELPLTLAIVEALLIKAADQTFAIPVEAVRETVKTPRSKFKSMMKKKAINLRGELIGVEALSDILQLKSADDTLDGEDEQIPILVLHNGRESMGIAVDQLLRREEIVIKPLVDYLAHLPGLAGASILGDGRALLILDPNELMAVASRGSLN